jgi:hypothetical protein
LIERVRRSRREHDSSEKRVTPGEEERVYRDSSIIVVRSFLKNQRESQSERREVSEDTNDRERSGERGHG